MNRLFRSLSFAGPVAAVAIAITSICAQAQDIRTVQGGRTTATLSPAFLADLKTDAITPTGLGGAPLNQSQIDFPISSGAINLDNAIGQILHSGGIVLTSAKSQVKVRSLILTTLGEVSVITALVEVNGKFLGRINLFDVELSGEIVLPIVPQDGQFLIGGTSLHLDPAGAAALNDAFGVKNFTDNLYCGFAHSTVFVPLVADGTM
jgi:hypothetical protein